MQQVPACALWGRVLDMHLPATLAVSHAQPALSHTAGTWYCTLPLVEPAATRHSPSQALLHHGTATCTKAMCGCQPQLPSCTACQLQLH